MLTFAMAHPYLTTIAMLTLFVIIDNMVGNLLSVHNNELKVRAAELAEREQEQDRKAGAP